MGELFGTDGIRGKAGVYPLDSITLSRIGQVLARSTAKIFICWDTRDSSETIYEALAGGIIAAGGHPVAGGVLPTPAASVLARKHGFDAAISISASHNPYEDNGIKILGSGGRKLPDDAEERIEAEVLSNGTTPAPAVKGVTPAESASTFVTDYCSFLSSHLALPRTPKIVVDCANGASTEAARRLLTPLGTHFIHDHPNGRNINDGCGSLHPESLQHAVIENKADIGVALDGDGDRAIFVDERGQVRDGDYTLYWIARHLQADNSLAGNTVVTTIMANMGLEVALARHGIAVRKTSVGDRYVLAEMDRCGAVLGGEQSGHTIRLDLGPAGDGLLTTVVVLNILAASGQPLSALSDGMHKFPQVLINVRVREKRDFSEIPDVDNMARAVQERLDGKGRLVLRFSGTEMLARVMIEGEDGRQIDRMANELADAIRKHLG